MARRAISQSVDDLEPRATGPVRVEAVEVTGDDRHRDRERQDAGDGARAAPCLCNQLPVSRRQPRTTLSISDSALPTRPSPRVPPSTHRLTINRGLTPSHGL